MVFLGIYRAIYDYAPQGEGELAIKEGDLLYVVEKDDDDWWKAKKKARSEDEEEPQGLIPNNYVEEVSKPHDACRGRAPRAPILHISCIALITQVVETSGSNVYASLCMNLRS